MVFAHMYSHISIDIKTHNFILIFDTLKVQSCKLYNITITLYVNNNDEILVFKLLSRKVFVYKQKIK